MINLFNKVYLDKLITTFPTIDTALSMIRFTIRPIKPAKQKYSYLAKNGAIKQAKI